MTACALATKNRGLSPIVPLAAENRGLSPIVSAYCFCPSVNQAACKEHLQGLRPVAG